MELGSGNDKTRPSEPYWDHQKLPYLQTLARLGVAPEDVSYVGLSHFHNDHVGFGTSLKEGKWIPTFLNAKYLMHLDEWAFWSTLSKDNPMWHPCIEDSVRPLVDAGLVNWASPVVGWRFISSSVPDSQSALAFSQF